MIINRTIGAILLALFVFFSQSPIMLYDYVFSMLAYEYCNCVTICFYINYLGIYCLLKEQLFMLKRHLFPVGNNGHRTFQHLNYVLL